MCHYPFHLPLPSSLHSSLLSPPHLHSSPPHTLCVTAAGKEKEEKKKMPRPTRVRGESRQSEERKKEKKKKKKKKEKIDSESWSVWSSAAAMPPSPGAGLFFDGISRTAEGRGKEK
ncbi:Hypothetical predicted protein [Scomber scombrus]|uniref:Uncharacterized protein n=1 Tax=Scomber scombrus TaxID=13677 RepID=A0AAV1NGX9_SCOSC